MPTSIHPFSQEEMMAYFDGELAPERALAAAQHLETCGECKELVQSMNQVSQALLEWKVEQVPMVAPVGTRPVRSKRTAFFGVRPSVLGFSVAALLVLVAGLPLWHEPQPAPLPHRSARPLERTHSPGFTEMPEQTEEQHAVDISPGGAARSAAVPELMSDTATLQTAKSQPGSGPLIVRTAELTITTDRFEDSRASIEKIVGEAKGYIAELSLSTSQDTGRTLDATLRAPAAQLDAVVQKLRTLGHVESESQRGEDVTQQSVDLNARISNLETTENRLLQLLRGGTGRLSDVLQVEEAVDRTRGEIEIARAEQKTLSNRVAFASIQLRVAEQYHASFNAKPGSLWGQVRNAAVEGFRKLVNLSTGILTFLLSFGPALLLIGGIGFFPGRWAWKRWRAAGGDVSS